MGDHGVTRIITATKTILRKAHFELEKNGSILIQKDLFIYQNFYLLSMCLLSHFSPVQFFMMLWTVAHQAPLSMGFFRQKYWSGFAMPFSRGSSQPRDWTLISYIYLHWQAGSLPLIPPGKPTHIYMWMEYILLEYISLGGIIIYIICIYKTYTYLSCVS